MSDPLKMKLPLAIVTGIVSASFAGGGAWAVAGQKMEKALAQNEANAARIEKLEAAEVDKKIRLTRVEDAFVNMAEMVKEIRQDVKDLKRR